MRVFLAVVRSLGRAGHEVHAAPRDHSSPALTSRYVHRVHALPRYGDGHEAWICTLQRILQDHAIDLVMPCCDSLMLPLHAHRRVLPPVRTAVPNETVMDDLFDKLRTRQLARKLEIPIAPGGQLESRDTAESLVARLGLPLVIKPRQSYRIDQLDSWGQVWIVETLQDLRARLAAIEDRTRFLVEGFFKGGEGVGVSVLASQGRILQAFQHRRLREGHGTSSSYRISEPVAHGLLNACQLICRDTSLTGVCMFEFRSNPLEGTWILIETNARLWGSLPLPVALGVDFPRLLHDLLLFGTEAEPLPYECGVRSRNLALDAHNLLSKLRARRVMRPGRLAADVFDFLAQPFRLASGREVSDSFVRDDMRPGFAELASILRRGRASQRSDDVRSTGRGNQAPGLPAESLSKAA